MLGRCDNGSSFAFASTGSVAAAGNHRYRSLSAAFQAGDLLVRGSGPVAREPQRAVSPSPRENSSTFIERRLGCYFKT